MPSSLLINWQNKSMGNRSHAFYDYLLETGALNGTPEQIAIARLSWRKIYKRNWKRSRAATKEIRIEFSVEQFSIIQQRAAKSQLPCTTFARNTILKAIGLERSVKKSPELLAALQLVSMMVNSAIREQHPDMEPLQKVETFLLQCLNVI